MDNKDFIAFCVSLKTEHSHIRLILWCHREKSRKKYLKPKFFGSLEFIIWTLDQDKHKMSENTNKQNTAYI